MKISFLWGCSALAVLVSASTVSAQTNDPSRPSADATAATAPPAVPLSPKLWGALLPLEGSVWTVNNISTYSISWDRPGLGLVIRRSGLYGGAETFIVPTPDGKNLRYIARDQGTGVVTETVVKPSGDKRFTLVSLPDSRTECTPAKRSANFACRTFALDGKKWREQTGFGLVQSDGKGAAALLAKLPGQFPGWPAGHFHPQLGMMAGMAGQKWYASGGWRELDLVPDTFYPVYPNSNPSLIEIGQGASGPILVTQVSGSQVVFLTASGTEPLSGTTYNGTIDSPGYRAPTSLSIGKNGEASLCFQQRYGDARQCDRWRVAADGKTALLTSEVSGEARYFQFYRAIPVVSDRRLGLFDKLNGRVFRSSGGSEARFVSIDGGGLFTLVSHGSDTVRYCSLNLKERAGTCSDEKGKAQPVAFSVAAGRLVIGDHEITLAGDIVTDRSIANPTQSRTFRETTPGMIALDQQAKDQADDLAQLRRNAAEMRADAQRRQQNWNASMAALSQQISNGSLTPSYMRPTDWSARLGSAGGGATGVGGYSSGMGTVKYVPMAPASAAYLARQDEIERYEIRKRLYSEAEGGYSPAQRARADRDDAAAKARSAAIVTEGEQRQRAYQTERAATEAKVDKDRADAQAQDDARFASAKAARAASDAKDRRNREAAQASADAKVAEARRKAALNTASTTRAAITVTDGSDRVLQTSTDEQARQAAAAAANDARRQANDDNARKMQADQAAYEAQLRKQKESYDNSKCGKMAKSKTGTAVCG